jgi:hypothetical protein
LLVAALGALANPIHTSAAQNPVSGQHPASDPIMSDALYVVSPGDSLGSIASRIEGRGAGSIQALSARILETNQHAFSDGDPGQILVGAEIRMPGPGPWMNRNAGRQWRQSDAEGIAPGATYRVGAGDTLSTIAGRITGRKSGTIELLAAQIHAGNPGAFTAGDISRIRLGAELRIPTSGPWQLAADMVPPDEVQATSTVKKLPVDDDSPAAVEAQNPGSSARAMVADSTVRETAIALQEISTDAFPERLALPLMYLQKARRAQAPGGESRAVQVPASESATVARQTAIPSRQAQAQTGQGPETAAAAAVATAVASTKPGSNNTGPGSNSGNGPRGGNPGGPGSSGAAEPRVPATNAAGTTGGISFALTDQVKAIIAGLGLGLVISALLLQTVFRKPKRASTRKRMGHASSLDVLRKSEPTEKPADYLETVIQKAPAFDDLPSGEPPGDLPDPAPESEDRAPLVASGSENTGDSEQDFGRETVPDIRARLEAQAAAELAGASDDMDPVSSVDESSDPGRELNASEINADTAPEPAPDAAAEEISVADVAVDGVLPWDDESIPALLDTQPDLEGAEEAEAMVVEESTDAESLAAFEAAGFGDQTAPDISTDDGKPIQEEIGDSADDRVVADMQDDEPNSESLLQFLDEVTPDEANATESEPVSPTAVDVAGGELFVDVADKDVVEFDLEEFNEPGPEDARAAVDGVHPQAMGNTAQLMCTTGSDDTGSEHPGMDDPDAIDLPALLATAGSDDARAASLSDALELLQQDYETEFSESQLLSPDQVESVISSQQES